MRLKIKKLPFNKKMTVFSDKEAKIFLFRPSKLTKRFSKYNIKKNFQIWIKEKVTGREFRPNHLRVLLDLNLRVRCRPKLKNQLCKAFDEIFYHKDPLSQIKELKKEKFKFYLNSISIIAVLSQLFIIEQEYNYIGGSKYNPPTLFYQGWVRQFLDSPKEIDNLVMSVCKFQPPTDKYTCLENSKHKKFCKNRKSLWYLFN